MTNSPYFKMVKTLKSKDRRVNQVKVNFSNEELRSLDQQKEKLHTDRSSLLRESFFRYTVLQQEGAGLIKEIYKLDNISIKNWSPIYTELDRCERQSKEISDNLKEYIDINLKDKNSFNAIYLRLLIDLDKLNKLNKLIADFRTRLYKANNAYDIPITEITERLDKLFNETDLYLNTSKRNKREDKLERNNTNIKILKIGETSQVFEILDTLKDGTPVIIDLSEIYKKDEGKCSQIMGNIKAGTYALSAKNYTLSDFLILIAPEKFQIIES